jgi:hypothetical protein
MTRKKRKKRNPAAPPDVEEAIIEIMVLARWIVLKAKPLAKEIEHTYVGRPAWAARKAFIPAAERLADLWAYLDAWLVNGGDLPQRWSKLDRRMNPPR